MPRLVALIKIKVFENKSAVLVIQQNCCECGYPLQGRAPKISELDLSKHSWENDDMMFQKVLLYNV